MIQLRFPFFLFSKLGKHAAPTHTGFGEDYNDHPIHRLCSLLWPVAGVRLSCLSFTAQVWASSQGLGSTFCCGNRLNRQNGRVRRGEHVQTQGGMEARYFQSTPRHTSTEFMCIPANGQLSKSINNYFLLVFCQHCLLWIYRWFDLNFSWITYPKINFKIKILIQLLV